MNKEKILRILYPRACPVCGEILTDKNKYDKNPYICKACYSNLSFTVGARCMKCAKKLDDETQELCDECESRQRIFDMGMVLLDHNEDAREIIYGFKFSFKWDNIEFPALEMAKRFGQRLLYLNVEAFIPVPLHKSRQRERGYNQAELLAKSIEKYMRGIYGQAPRTDGQYLFRKEKTRHQMDLDPMKREGNVRNAFEVRNEEDRPASVPKYRNVCLVDDIYTTGSTMNACARELKKAGCERVYFLAVSR